MEKTDFNIQTETPTDSNVSLSCLLGGVTALRVLVACEYSGRVRDAFAKLGHDATSCDLLPTESAGKHYTGNVFDIINDGWDLMIAHPPCTYLSRAGARWLHGAGKINQKRYEQGLDGKIFFEKLLNANIEMIAIENPTPLKIFGLPEPTQIIQPFEFGEPYSKRTLLWLKNLQPLKPTKIIKEHTPYLPSNTGGKKRGQKATFRNITQKESSKTFMGIANAMAEQWGGKVTST